MDVIEAIKQRHSVRAFLDKPVSRETLRTILDAARRAPSGTNMQPWQVAVITGAAKDHLSQVIIAAAEAGIAPHPEYSHYPTEWFEPYKSRRYTCGMALYGALGIRREETERRRQAWYDNYRFFGAPVGLIFHMQRDMAQGSWVDMGIFVQSVMLTAQSLGLGTCPQASLTDYHDVVRASLGLSDEQVLVCGMSLGYPDTAAAVNRYRLERVEVDEFTTWHE